MTTTRGPRISPFAAVLGPMGTGLFAERDSHREHRKPPPSEAPSAPRTAAGLYGGGGRFSGASSAAPRTAAAVDDSGDVVVMEPSPYAVEVARAEAELGRARTLRTAVELLNGKRTAGDVRSGNATGVPTGVDAATWWGMSPTARDAWFASHSSAASEVFDPADPASMTRERWATMGEPERRAWIEANVRDSNQRAELIRTSITGVFTAVGDVVRTIRETRLAEIREAAATERARMTTELEAERARLDAASQRAQIDADRARAEADRAMAQAAAETNATARAAAEAAAAEARERAATAQRLADEAAAERRRVEAQANALATVGGASWSFGEKAAAAGGAALLALLAFLGWRSSQASQAPRYGVQA